MASQPKHEDDDTEAERKIDRLRRMLAELSEAIREVETMLKRAERDPEAR